MSKIASKALSAGKMVQVRRLEFTANNIANASTPGYKASVPFFQRMLSATEADGKVSKPFPSPDEMTTFIDFSEASLIETNGNLDLAIEGNGFFVVSVQDRTMYTRNGQFKVDEQKRLVTGSGFPVMGVGGEIVLNGTDIAIESDGSIYADGTLVDTVKVVDFDDRKVLQNFGLSLFENISAEDTESVPEAFAVKQGFIEASNVNVMEEMVNLINCLRVYQAYDKARGQMKEADDKMLAMPRLK